jgi:hypothetical protein
VASIGDTLQGIYLGLFQQLCNKFAKSPRISIVVCNVNIYEIINRYLHHARSAFEGVASVSSPNTTAVSARYHTLIRFHGVLKNIGRGLSPPDAQFIFSLVELEELEPSTSCLQIMLVGIAKQAFVLHMSCGLRGNSGRLRIQATITCEGISLGEITCAGIRRTETDKAFTAGCRMLNRSTRVFSESSCIF